jgi:hypothetical protein
LLLLPLAVVLCGWSSSASSGISAAGMVSRTSFDCPFAKRHGVEFLTEAGSDRPVAFSPAPSSPRSRTTCAARRRVSAWPRPVPRRRP